MFDKYRDRFKKFEEDHDSVRAVHRHFTDHKMAYAVGATGVSCLIVGGGVGVALGGVDVKQTVDSFKFIHIQWKSPNINIAMNKPELNPPQPILDKMTGIPYPSMNETARQTGETLGKIRADAHGFQTRFEKLPETVFALVF